MPDDPKPADTTAAPEGTPTGLYSTDPADNAPLGDLPPSHVTLSHDVTAVTETSTADAPPTDGDEEPIAASPPEEKLSRKQREQQRINEAIRGQYEALARQQELEEELEALKAGQVPDETPPEAPKTDAVSAEAPKQDDFDTYEEFLRADAEFVAMQKVAGLREELLAEVKAERAKAEAETKAVSDREAAAAYMQKIDEAKTRLPDWADVVEEKGGSLPMSPAMMDATRESDRPGDVLYYLAQHPERCAEINAMSPVRAIRAIGEIDMDTQPTATTDDPGLTAAAPRPAAASPQPRRRLPAPPTEVGTSPTLPRKDPSNMTHAEFKAWREQAAG